MDRNLPYYDADSIVGLVSFGEAVDALRSYFSVPIAHADRLHLHAGTGEFLIMPAASATAGGVKLIGIQPANPARGLPIIQGIYVLFDMTIGAPIALMDGAALTTLRTPAISALATDVLARQDVTSVGIVGTGPQALAHVAAMRHVRATIVDVVVAGRTAAHVDQLVGTLRDQGLNARSGTFAQAAACDVVCGCTRSSGALFCAEQVRPGTHLNLVGSYRLDLREVASDVVAASTVVVDDLAAARAEAGDLHLAVVDGAWSWDLVRGDLHDLATGQLSRATNDEITLFKSVGLAAQDLAIAELVARKSGLVSKEEE